MKRKHSQLALQNRFHPFVSACAFPVILPILSIRSACQDYLDSLF
jgi:hypothetical protein